MTDTNELTVHDLLTTPELKAPREFRGGVIHVSSDLMETLGIDMRGCTVQGDFADKGVFADIHKRLLLPANYTIRGLFFRFPYYQWEIVVESPGLPPVSQAQEPPEITPVYQRIDEGLEHTYRLLSIRIEKRWEHAYTPGEITLERL